MRLTRLVTRCFSTHLKVWANSIELLLFPARNLIINKFKPWLILHNHGFQFVLEKLKTMLKQNLIF